jgi:hypothetical protein
VRYGLDSDSRAVMLGPPWRDKSHGTKDPGLEPQQEAPSHR